MNKYTFSIWYYCVMVFIIAAGNWVYGGISGKVALGADAGAFFLALALTLDCWLEHRKELKDQHRKTAEQDC